MEVLNEVINKKRSKSRLPSSFRTSDNTEISDPTEIATRFCNYFSCIGPTLAKKIKPSSVSHRQFLSGCFPQSVFHDNVTTVEIIEISKTFQSNKAAVYDKIPMSIIINGLLMSLLNHLLT